MNLSAAKDESWPEPCPPDDMMPGGASRAEYVDARKVLWVTIWGGTVAAGGIFGLLFGMISGSLESMLACLVIGLIWSGVTASLAMIHIGLIKWFFGLECSPVFLAGLCGGLAGLPTIFPPLTILFGALGAIYSVWCLLETETGKPLLLEEERRKNRTGPRKSSYSLADLFKRMTVIAVYIAIWVAILR